MTKFPPPEDAIRRMRELVAARAPFVHQGRSTTGIDCVGALIHAIDYKGCVPAYPRDPVNGELERQLTAIFGDPVVVGPVTMGHLKAGDVIAMQYAGPTRHVGMVCDHVSIPGALSMIHTDSILGEVTEHIMDDRWLRRVTKVWRYG